MTVRKNERHVSSIEYENTGIKIVNYLNGKINKIPGRCRHSLAEPFSAVLCEFYEKVIRLADDYKFNVITNSARRLLAQEAVNCLEELIGYSYTYWNLSAEKRNAFRYVPYKKRVYWADMINRELELLAGVIKKTYGKNSAFIFPHFMKPYPNEAIKDNEILSALSRLERIVFKKAVNMRTSFRDIHMEMLLAASRNALYYAMDAYSLTLKDTYEMNRAKNSIGEAIGYLYQMNRFIKELAFDGFFTEKELSELCTEIPNCITKLRKAEESAKDRVSLGLKFTW